MTSQSPVDPASGSSGPHSEDEGPGQHQDSMPAGPIEWATVLKSLPNKMLRVRTDEGDVVDVHASGAMRVRIVRLLAGDRLRVQRSPFDPSKGRVTDLAEGV